MKRVIFQVLKFSVAFLLILYVADWGIFLIRVQRQAGLGSVQVDRFLGTRLKGEKEEYDYLGSVEQACARSIFPHASNPPCWWVEQHKTQWEQ